MTTVTMALPVQPFTITQAFGANPEWYARWGYAGHNGLDLRAMVGTAVNALDEGVVIETGFSKNGYGIYLVIEHDWGISLYAHLSEIKIPSGAVKRNQTIALSGNTGWSTGPHLHVGIKQNNQENPAYKGWQDPQPFLDNHEI